MNCEQTAKKLYQLIAFMKAADAMSGWSSLETDDMVVGIVASALAQIAEDVRDYADSDEDGAPTETIPLSALFNALAGYPTGTRKPTVTTEDCDL